jgi:hypothetical protein
MIQEDKLSDNEVKTFANLERILFARTVAIVTTIMQGLETKHNDKITSIEERLVVSKAKNPQPNKFEIGQLLALKEIHFGLEQFLILESNNAKARIEKLEEINE